MPEICILVMSGFPASGKSTFAKALCEHLNELRDYVCYHVCYDAILSTDIELKLLELCGVVSSDHSRPSQWKDYRRKITRCVDHLVSLEQSIDQDIFTMNFLDIDYHVMDRLRKTIGLEVSCPSPDDLMDMDVDFLKPKKRLLIIIDDNMYYQSMRYEYYQIAKKYHCGFAQLCLECSLETTLLRNHQRSLHVADDVIINMASKFEQPDPVNNSWEHFSLVWNTEFGGNICDVDRLIEQAFENPVMSPPSEDADARAAQRIVCSSSFVHQSDQILRRIVSNKMSMAKGCGKLSKNDMKSLASCLNTIRTRMLSWLKKGQLITPGDFSPVSVKDASKDSTSALYQFLTQAFDTWTSIPAR